MQTIEYTTRDRSNWGDGPWQNEPDKRQWQDAATGLPCLIVRGPSGAWCGYVGVSEGHPLYGQDYDGPGSSIDVHGGLTFAGACHPGDECDNICHKPDAGEPDNVWWFGFDCMHLYDMGPDKRYWVAGLSREETYRDVAFVTAEVGSLAKQLSQVAQR